jgi:heat shock protein HslJ
MRKTVVLAALQLIAAGCGDSDSTPAPVVAAAPEATTSGKILTAPTPAEAASSTYSGIYQEPVTLTEGVYEGAPFDTGGASRPRVALITGMHLDVDLDGNPGDEAVVLLSESSGGSGSFTYLAVLDRTESEVRNVDTVALGDRIQIRGWRVEDGAVVVRLVEAGPEDAACCPSRLVNRRWTLSEGRLREGAAESEGTLGLSALEGVQWRLADFDVGERLPAEPEILLEVHGDRVAGNSGCNRYTGSLATGTAPGEIRFGPLAGTRMACPGASMALEQRFLETMSSVSRFSFHFGRLVLTSVAEDGAVKSLVFEARPIADGG